jgi:hypothetical protein
MKRIVKQAFVLIFVLGSLQSHVIMAKKCNDLIMLFDPDMKEDVDGRLKSVTEEFISNLYEKAAPMVVSRNIVKNFCFWKTEYKQIFEDIKQKSLSKSTYLAERIAEDLFSHIKDLNEVSGRFWVFVSGADLSGNDWDCYAHKQSDLVLLIPKNYSARGFNVTYLDKIADVSSASVLHYIQSKKIERPTKIVDAVKSMFMVKKSADQQESIAWNFCVIGHGGSAEQKGGVVVQQTAWIAGMSYDDSVELMAFFNNDIETNFVMYITCFFGGYNQTFINDVLQKLNINFIVAAQGIGEMETNRSTPIIKTEQSSNQLLLPRMRFTNYFGLLENFFGEQASRVGVQLPQQWEKDPIAAIVGAITDMSFLQNQPFVRIPAVGVFTALNVDKQVKILTHSIVKAYEFEGRTIDCSNPEIKAVIVYPTHIKVPLKIDSKIVSPNPQKIEQLYEVTHVFDEIIFGQPLYRAIFNMIESNSSYSKITFVIKKLRTHDRFAGSAEAENMVIQIIGKASGRGVIRSSVELMYTMNGETCQQSIPSTLLGITESREFFDTYKSSPAVKIKPEDTSAQAMKFLSEKDVKIFQGKSITLADVVEYFEAQVDKTFGVQQVSAFKKVIEKRETMTAKKNLFEEKKEFVKQLMSKNLESQKKELETLK